MREAGTAMPVDKDYLPVLNAVIGNLTKADAILKEEESGDASQSRSGIPESSGSSGQQKAPQIKTGAGEEDSAKEGLRKMNDRVTSW